MFRHVLITAALLCLVLCRANAQKGSKLYFLLEGGSVLRGVVLSVDESILYLDTVQDTWTGDRPLDLNAVASVPVCDVKYVWGYADTVQTGMCTGLRIALGGLLGMAVGFYGTGLVVATPETSSGFGALGAQLKMLAGAAIGLCVGMVAGGLIHGGSEIEQFELRGEDPEFAMQLRELAVLREEIPRLDITYRKR